MSSQRAATTNQKPENRTFYLTGPDSLRVGEPSLHGEGGRESRALFINFIGGGWAGFGFGFAFSGIGDSCCLVLCACLLFWVGQVCLLFVSLLFHITLFEVTLLTLRLQVLHTCTCTVLATGICDLAATQASNNLQEDTQVEPLITHHYAYYERRKRTPS